MFLFTFMGSAVATFALGAFFSRMVADSWRVLPLVWPHSYTGSFSSLSKNGVSELVLDDKSELSDLKILETTPEKKHQDCLIQFFFFLVSEGRELVIGG